jgi:hypothetical protein
MLLKLQQRGKKSHQSQQKSQQLSAQRHVVLTRNSSE